MTVNKYLIGIGVVILIAASGFMNLRPRAELSVHTSKAVNVDIIGKTLASDHKMMKSKDILDCNKHSIRSFSSCLVEHFPVGSSYVELKHFLHEQGFKQPKDELDLKSNKFYFFWWANDLSNYKIVVGGRLDQDFRILELKVS